MSSLRSVALRRSAVASAEIVVAFCVAHLAAGGQLPTPQWLLAAGGSVFLASWLVIRRRFRLRWMVPVLTVAQLWLHLTASAATAAAASPGHAGHAHLHGEQPVMTWSMLAAHLVAAGVTALIWAFRRRLWRVLRVRPPVVTTNPIAPRLSATAPARFVRDLLWVQGGPRRGPPVAPAPAH